MTSRTYQTPPGGLPPQTEKLTDRAVFAESFAVIPSGVMRDIVTSRLPHWDNTRAWILARPMTGFAETFAQYIVEVAAGGGSDSPEPEAGAEAALFVTTGEITLTLDDQAHLLGPGGFAYIPPSTSWRVHNAGTETASFHWIRKAYEAASGIDEPEPVVTNERDIEPVVMPHSNGTWEVTRFVDPEDLRHDMHINVVTFAPGGVLPFMETHVMEHGIYVLEGKGVYRLNERWVEVAAGDFMWLRAYCPQACYAGGPGPFRYLLYKDVHRHPKLATRRRD